jgi:hypothetical protein
MAAAAAHGPEAFGDEVHPIVLLKFSRIFSSSNKHIIREARENSLISFHSLSEIGSLSPVFVVPTRRRTTQ